MTMEEFMVWEEKLEKKEIAMNVEMMEVDAIENLAEVDDVEMMEVDGVENLAEVDDVEMLEMNKIILINADETETQ